MSLSPLQAFEGKKFRCVPGSVCKLLLALIGAMLRRA